MDFLQTSDHSLCQPVNIEGANIYFRCVDNHFTADANSLSWKLLKLVINTFLMVARSKANSAGTRLEKNPTYGVVSRYFLFHNVCYITENVYQMNYLKVMYLYTSSTS